MEARRSNMKFTSLIPLLFLVLQPFSVSADNKSLKYKCPKSVPFLKGIKIQKEETHVTLYEGIGNPQKYGLGPNSFVQKGKFNKSPSYCPYQVEAIVASKISTDVGYCTYVCDDGQSFILNIGLNSSCVIENSANFIGFRCSEKP